VGTRSLKQARRKIWRKEAIDCFDGFVSGEVPCLDLGDRVLTAIRIRIYDQGSASSAYQRHRKSPR
jgi:hypothetical protein